jgi:hypothetical protein
MQVRSDRRRFNKRDFAKFKRIAPQEADFMKVGHRFGSAAKGGVAALPAGGGEECLIYIKSDERVKILRRGNFPLGVASSLKKGTANLPWDAMSAASGRKRRPRFARKWLGGGEGSLPIERPY